MTFILGLDVGGANIKGCNLQVDGDHINSAKGKSVYYEIWRNTHGLKDVLIRLCNSLKEKKAQEFDEIALTMTAELCDSFESKTQGVLTIVQTVEEIFENTPLYVWTTQEVFASPPEIRKNPLQAAAANWLASAAALANSSSLDDSPVIFIDMGSTTTDILPVTAGKVLPRGRTDTERLLSGELLYTGVLRTAVHSIVDEVVLDGFRCRVANEYFASSADVYSLLGWITETDYNIPTPDGKSRDFYGCAKRLARVVAAEPEELGMENIYLIAQYIMEKQIQQVMNNILQVVSRREMPLPKKLVTTGQGTFILKEVARRLGWNVSPWWKMFPCAKPELPMTSYAVAWLLSQQYERGCDP